MTFTLDGHVVGLALIVLCVIAIAAITWSFADKQRVAAEEQRLLREFEREMAAVKLTEWNGATYDEWPPNLARYLNDTYAYQQPALPETAPMPVLTDETDAYIAVLRAKTDAWMRRHALA